MSEGEGIIMDDCWFLARATGWVGLFLEIGEWGYEGNSLGRGVRSKASLWSC